MDKSQPRILLVEDNELDVEKFLRACKRLKIANAVTRVSNGCDALAVLRGANGVQQIQSPYVIMLDLNMPGMNGLEFLRELRGDASLCTAPVFVLTTSEQRSEIQAAYRLNVCGYIAKPLKMDEMLNALRTLHDFWQLCELPLAGAPS